MPFLWRNYSERDLAAWPFFEGVSSEDIRRHQETIARVSAEMGELYAAVIRTGQPGAAWPAFDPSTWDVLWFGEQVEVRPGLLRTEWDSYRQLGFDSPRSLEDALLAKVRDARTPDTGN